MALSINIKHTFSLPHKRLNFQHRDITTSLCNRILESPTAPRISRSLSLRITPSYKTNFHLKLPALNKHIITLTDQVKEAAKICTEEEKEEMLFFCTHIELNLDATLHLINNYDFKESTKIELVNSIIKGTESNKFKHEFLKRNFNHFNITNYNTLKNIAFRLCETKNEDLLFLLKNILNQIPEEQEFRLEIIKNLVSASLDVTFERSRFFLCHLPEFHEKIEHLEDIINRLYKFDRACFFDYFPDIMKTLRLDPSAKNRICKKILKESASEYLLDLDRGEKQKNDRLMHIKAALTLFKDLCVDPIAAQEFLPYIKENLLHLAKSPDEKNLFFIYEFIKTHNLNCFFKIELIRKILLKSHHSLDKNTQFILDHIHDFSTGDLQLIHRIYQAIAEYLVLTRRFSCASNNPLLLKEICLICSQCPNRLTDFFCKINGGQELFSSVIIENWKQSAEYKLIEATFMQIASYKTPALSAHLFTFFLQNLPNKTYTSIYTSLTSSETKNSCQIDPLKIFPSIYPAFWMKDLTDEELDAGYKAYEKIASLFTLFNEKNQITHEHGSAFLEEFFSNCLTLNNNNLLSNSEKLHITSAFCQLAKNSCSNSSKTLTILKTLLNRKDASTTILQALKFFDLYDKQVFDELLPCLQILVISQSDPTRIEHPPMLCELIKIPHCNQEFKKKLIQKILKYRNKSAIIYLLQYTHNQKDLNQEFIDFVYNSIAQNTTARYHVKISEIINYDKNQKLAKALGLRHLQLGYWDDFSQEVNPSRALRSSIILESWQKITDEKSLETTFKELAKYRNNSIANAMISFFCRGIQNKKYISNYTSLTSIKIGNAWQPARIKALPFIYPALWLTRLELNDIEDGYKACEQISCFLYSSKVKKYIENEVKYSLLQDFLAVCIAMDNNISSKLKRLLILSGFCKLIEDPTVHYNTLSKDLKLIHLICSQEFGDDLYADLVEKGQLKAENFYQNTVKKFLREWQCDPIKNSFENYAKSFAQTRVPFSIITYAKNHLPGIKEDLRRFIQKTLEGTVLEERYRTDVNPNLFQLHANSPDLFNHWKELDVEIKTEKFLAQIQDDPLLLFELPTLIGGSCLDLNGQYRECLLAYCLDGTVKMITVQESDLFTARSILRILFNEKMAPFLFLEPLYYKDSQNIKKEEAQEAIIKIADKAAEKLKLPLFVRYKNKAISSSISVSWQGGPCAFFYSDAFGGCFPKNSTSFTIFNVHPRLSQ